MNSGRRTLWNALVWALIPFTLGAGFPQMQCRCAAAKGQRWCECCFQKSDASKPVESTNKKHCCQSRLAKLNGDSRPAMKATSGCQTCQSHANPTGSCCELKSPDASALSKTMDAPAADLNLMRLPSIECQVAANSLGEDWRLKDLNRPSLDRVVVFAHLLI